MGAAGGDADDAIAGAYPAAVEQRRFFHRADAKTGQIVFAGRVHVGHFGGLAADQRAAGQFTAFRDPADHGHRGVDIELAGGEVIEEEQRLGALHQHIVDAHADQVDADLRVPAQRLRQLELGADAVGTGHQNRFAVPTREVEQGAETAKATHHLRSEGALDQRLDALDEGVAGIDIDPGIAVGQGRWRAHGGDCGSLRDGHCTGTLLRRSAVRRNTVTLLPNSPVARPMRLAGRRVQPAPAHRPASGPGRTPSACGRCCR